MKGVCRLLLCAAVSAAILSLAAAGDSGAIRNKRGNGCPRMMGRRDICNLQFDQVTFPGTHNSGSGFSGDLRLRNGFPAAACVYRNQDMNYTAQLEFGIRWFDIDLCYVSEAEATPAVPAGLWTCHSNGYAGLVEDIVKQVDDWMNQETNRGEIVSLFFNGDYDRSRSEPIAAALNELLTSYWGINIVRRKRGSRPTVVMNEDFNFTGQWPTLFRAFSNNERVFVFLHETLQLGEQRWAHDPIPSESPSEVIKDSCDNLIDFTTGACNVCTDLWGIDAIGNRGNCIYRTAEICNTITYNVTRGCLDLRMDYGKTLNVIEVDFPDRAPGGLSVVDIADKFNDLNVNFFLTPPSPPLIPDMNNCTPAFTPTPSPSPKPRPADYCTALEQISETPLFYFQCSPNDACSALDCPIDLFADGAFFNLRVWVQTNCDGAPAFVMEMFTPQGQSAGRISASETGLYILLAFPLFITVDQMDNAIGVAVVLVTGDNRPDINNNILEYQIIPLPEECPGVKLVNDTVIADPLFTAPVGDGSTHFCYEVHGTPNTIFNLVSDKCTVVNAEYVPMIIPSNGNVIGAVGVRAADSAGNCHNIEVRFSQSGSGLDAFVDGEEVSGVTRVDSVQVRRYSNRVRISVPNCELVDLVMWVIMVEMMGQNMIKFVITRGVNLAPTSHGLVGQFWNVPVSMSLYEGPLRPGYEHRDNLYLITVTPDDGETRSFLGELHHLTWDHRAGPCYYVGSSQGGRTGEREENDSVIDGYYTDYEVGSLFDDNFVYSQFERERCTQTA